MVSWRMAFSLSRRYSLVRAFPGKSEFTKHMIRFRHMGANVVKVGDNIPEKVILINSHDGTSAYKLYSGIFRVVCTNGLVVLLSEYG